MIADLPLPRLKELLRTRRAYAETSPCAEYIPKTVGGYGWDACIRCGWSEPEHLIDALDRALGTAEAALEAALARLSALEQNRHG